MFVGHGADASGSPQAPNTVERLKRNLQECGAHCENNPNTRPRAKRGLLLQLTQRGTQDCSETSGAPPTPDCPATSRAPPTSHPASPEQQFHNSFSFHSPSPSASLSCDLMPARVRLSCCRVCCCVGNRSFGDVFVKRRRPRTSLTLSHYFADASGHPAAWRTGSGG